MIPFARAAGGVGREERRKEGKEQMMNNEMGMQGNTRR